MHFLRVNRASDTTALVAPGSVLFRWHRCGGHHAPWLALVVLVFCGFMSGVNAQTAVVWGSTIGKPHLTSGNAPMDVSFRFQAGYFNTGFTPTSGNTADWLANWNPVDSVNYSPSLQWFESSYDVDEDPNYEAAGKKGYVWGFSGNEWILYSHTGSAGNPAWVWPQQYGPPSPTPPWTAKVANQVILGQIIASETPYLLKSATVTNSRPPDTPWAVWQEQFFGAGPNSGPNDDADNDGADNLLEFVMGTDPKKSGGIPATPSQIVTVAENKYLQITIPRRIDRPATLIVEVANSPAGLWSSGASHTTTVSNTISSLIVRDNIPITPSHPKRFMRLRVVLP